MNQTVPGKANAKPGMLFYKETRQEASASCFFPKAPFFRKKRKKPCHRVGLKRHDKLVFEMLK